MRSKRSWARRMSTLGSSRLVLRMFRESDLDAYAAMCGDPEVMRYLGDGYPLTRAESWRNMALSWATGICADLASGPSKNERTGLLAGRVGCWQPEGWPGLRNRLDLPPRVLGPRLRDRGRSNRACRYRFPTRETRV